MFAPIWAERACTASNLKGPIGLVIGNEGEGVSRLVREKCDFIASIPMKGDIDS
ncbi:MAG: TrmH family RNA methyltransferase [Clostridium fessum]